MCILQPSLKRFENVLSVFPFFTMHAVDTTVLIECLNYSAVLNVDRVLLETVDLLAHVISTANYFYLYYCLVNIV